MVSLNPDSKSIDLQAKDLNAKITRRTTHASFYWKRDTDEHFIEACKLYEANMDAWKARIAQIKADNPKE